MQQAIATIFLSLITALPFCCTFASAGDTTNKTKSPNWVFRIHGDKPPVLSTNRVMAIAWEAASTNRFSRKTNDFRCDFFSFAGSTTSTHTSNKWILHFVRKQGATPDTDFFVTVEDSSGKPDVWHY